MTTTTAPPRITGAPRDDGPDLRVADGDQSTREAFRDAVVEALPRDPRLVCLDSDTGLFGAAAFGTAADRYVNIGIAEHTLVATAAGLARQGFRPVVVTMAAFAASRAIEAVKLDVALGDLPVLLAGTHAGVSAGHLGPTHHALEDLAAMRTLPHMTVLVPADAEETRHLVEQAWELPGPSYLRLGRNATPALPAPVAPGAPARHPRIGRAEVLRSGDDVLLVACGPGPVLAALAAADVLAGDGIAATVVNASTVKPLDEETLLPLLRAGGAAVSVEEHWRTGGLGSALSELAGTHFPVPVIRVGFSDEFVHDGGPADHLLAAGGVDVPGVVAAAHRSRQMRGAAR